MSVATAEVLQPTQARGRIAGMNRPTHLFILKTEVIHAVADDEERGATLEALREMDLYRLPYDHDVYVQINASETDPLNAELDNKFLIYGPMDVERPEIIFLNGKTGQSLNITKTHPAGGAMHLYAFILKDILIIALATRNAEKVTTENKLAKLGIGKSQKHRFRFTTTISLPREMEDDPDNPPHGAGKAAHLRRGHIRRQHYGTGNLLEKKIWIAPVFVNADPSFVNSRKSYTVRL